MGLAGCCEGLGWAPDGGGRGLDESGRAEVAFKPLPDPSKPLSPPSGRVLHGTVSAV